MARHQTILSAATVGTISCRFQATSTVGWSFFMTAWELSQHWAGDSKSTVTNKSNQIQHRSLKSYIECLWMLLRGWSQILQHLVCLLFFHADDAAHHVPLWPSKKSTSKWGDLRPPKLPLEDDERAEKWCLGLFFVYFLFIWCCCCGGGGV